MIGGGDLRVAETTVKGLKAIRLALPARGPEEYSCISQGPREDVSRYRAFFDGSSGGPLGFMRRMTTDWRTWSPFQSQTAKEICAHMTADEKRSVTSFGLASGVIVAIFFAIPGSFGVSLLGSLIFGLPGIALLAWLVIGVFVTLHRRWKGRELRCSTEWAKSRGISADSV